MTSIAHSLTATLLTALTLALSACGKPADPATASTAAAASAASAATSGEKAMTLADCDKLPDPQPADQSATGRSTAVSQGVAARMACKRQVEAHERDPNGDLARIREIKEHEEAQRVGDKMSEEEWKRGAREGAHAPIKTYKY